MWAEPASNPTTPQCHPACPPLEGGTKDLGPWGASRLFPNHLIIDNLMRYEAHLHRQYIQTLHEIEALQARRRGERTPLARLDITGSPAG